jgi:2-polyprenyl-6-methoxyphenol hydroxylase-like FAD-dependent oxidoreductase
MNPSTHSVQVCIAGGGPAGLLAGLLLAKQGIRTLVLEQHHDFEREYRGEVLMPRFTELFRQLNLFDYMEGFPHARIDTAEFFVGDHQLAQIPFRQICADAPFAFWMPQPIFLNALYEKARTLPDFDLWFGASAEQLIQKDGQTTGVLVHRNDQTIQVTADVTIGADGRTSRMQRLGNFQLEYEQHQFDVLWFSLPRPANYSTAVQIAFSKSHPYIIAPKYPDLIQCGLFVAPGQFTEFRNQGIDSLRKILLDGPSAFHDFANNLTGLKPFHPLQAKIALVKQWAQDGLLLIGDAAHTCSPAGAIGVSVALETATIAAEVVAKAIRNQNVSADVLGEVQRIRESEVRRIQARQAQLGKLIAAPSWIRQYIMPVLFPILVRLGLVQSAMRQVVVPSQPIPVDPALRF